MERPKNNVPCQKPLAVFRGVLWNPMIVVTAAATQPVATSVNIQSLAVPREPRVGPPEALDSDSVDKAKDDDSLCQKSELAIKET